MTMETKSIVPTVGMKFRSFVELDKFLNNYYKLSNEIFVKYKSVKHSPRYKRVLKEEIIYHEICYCCKHGRKKHSSVQSVRKKRSLKVDCPAKILVHASNDGKFLIISYVSLDHKDHLNTKLDPVPENRKLTTSEMEFVTKAIDLQCKRPHLIKMVKDEFDVHITAKDLKNIAYKRKLEVTHEFTAVINLLHKEGARIDVLKEDSCFEGMFFTTKDMSVSTKSWGQIIFFDGTYKLIAGGLIVILFLVEDGNLLTELSAVAIVKREDKPTIDWIFQCFKKHHESAIANIKYFMCDKNATQRTAIQTFFPHTITLICLFHTKQIFQRKIQELDLSKDEKEFCLKILNKIIYSKDDEQYNYYFDIIANKFPDKAKDYFIKNWHEIKDEWTCFEKHKNTYYNRTNNRCESMNQKLKAVVNKLTSFHKAIEQFFKWKHFHDEENKSKIVKNFGSKLPLQQSSVEYQYSELVMDGPFKIIEEELKNKSYITFDFKNLKNEFEIKKTKRITTISECNCLIFVAYSLPCRHIFAVRETEKLNLFDEHLCHERWTKTYCRKYHRIFAEYCVEKYPVTIKEKIQELIDEKEGRRIKINELISDLVDVISQFCGYKFIQKLSILYELFSSWSSDDTNIDVEILEKDSGNNIEMDNIVSQLKSLNFIDNNFTKLTVPQKRNRVSKLLKTFEIFVTYDKIWESLIYVLEKVKSAWTDAKHVHIVHSTLHNNQTTTNNEIQLPKNVKTPGRPKHLLITYKKYNTKKK